MRRNGASHKKRHVVENGKVRARQFMYPRNTHISLLKGERDYFGWDILFRKIYKKEAKECVRIWGAPGITIDATSLRTEFFRYSLRGTVWLTYGSAE